MHQGRGHGERCTLTGGTPEGLPDVALDTEDQLAQPDRLGVECFQVYPHRPQPETSHLLAVMRRDPQHAARGLDHTKTKAVSVIILHADEHAVESVEVELFRKGWGEHGRLDPPPLERRGESNAERIGLPGVAVGRRR